MPFLAILLSVGVSLAATPEPPQATLRWKRGLATLTVQPPPGEHVDDASPVRIVVEQGDARTELAAHGEHLVGGWDFGVVEGPLTGELRLSLCEDGGTLCRVVDLAIQGRVQGRKGSTALALTPAAATAVQPPAHAGTAYVADPDAAVAEALAQAATTGQRVLLDFGAAWCPPCNLLAAEVLDDPADADALRGFRVVAIDADRRDSWMLKDRYEVGGYPTVVAVDATGRELSRVEGYNGEDAFLAWLSALDQGLDLDVLLATPPEPRAAALLAWQLAAQGRHEDARELLHIAQHDAALDDTLPLRRARLLLAEEPAAADLAWLLQHETDRAALLTWIWGVRELAASTPALAADTRQLLLRHALDAPPVQAADLLYVVAGLASEADAPSLYAAAAIVLRGGLTGDRLRDKGLLTSLADLHAKAGQVDAAVQVLRDGARDWPDEMTFPYALAGVLLDAERPADAVAPARAALAASYDDNRLRAARRLAQALDAAGQRDEARAVVDAALAEAEAPGDGVDVRTPRYIQALTELRAELAE